MDSDQVNAEIDQQVMDKLSWVQPHKTGDPEKDWFLEQGFITYGAMVKSLTAMKKLGDLHPMEIMALDMSMDLWKDMLSRVSGQLVNG